MKFLRARLAGFGRDARGSLSIEAAIMVPLIVWIYVTTFTYFETFRADASNVKAAYSIGDMMSRETNPIDAAYVDGMNNVFHYMVLAEQPTWLRVSSVTFDGTDLVLQWSHASGSHPPATLPEIEARVPTMAKGDSVIVVETFMPYKPDYNIGLKPFTFRNVVVTRPRFAPQLLWAGV